MSVAARRLSINTSTASSIADSSDDIEALKVKNYVKDLLKSRIFLGRYLERRLATESIGYRDIVLLSVAEQEFNRDLLEAEQKLRSVCPSQWIGITNGEVIGYSGICLWTEIDNQPFGPFWFQVRSVRFRDDEVILSLKCIRHITEAFLELEPLLTGPKTSYASKKSSQTKAELNESFTEIVTTLKSAMTVRNIKELITFGCALVIAVFTGSTAFVNFLGNFILALLREMSYLVKNSTPMFLGILDFMSKIVGGFYILMAMIFKPRNSAPPPPSRRALNYYDRNHRPSYTSNKAFDYSFD